MQFKGFPVLDWDKILRRQYIAIECDDYIPNLFSKIRFLFCHRRIEYKFIRKFDFSRVLCFQSCYQRKNYQNQMLEFASLSDIDLLRGEQSSYRVTSPLFFLKYIVVWFREIRKQNIGVNLAIDIVIQLIKYFDLLVFLQDVDFKKYNLLVTFCDAYDDEAFVTEYIKLFSIKSATLEHGAFVAKRTNMFVNSGVELRCTNSDIFLAWNQMTVDEAYKQGVVGVAFKKVGILGFIGKPYNNCIYPQNNFFGVVINHPDFEQDNITLIKSANTLARTFGLNYYLKLHPNYMEHYFDDIVDKKFYRGVVNKSISMLEYANSVDFSVLGSSSVFCELVYLFHNIMRYSSGNNDDKFRDVPYGNVFKSEYDIVNSYQKGFNIEDKKLLFNYLCETKDVTKSYRDFIKEYE